MREYSMGAKGWQMSWVLALPIKRRRFEMTIFQNRTFTNAMAITATAILLAPATHAEIGLGVGVSVGGHGSHGGAEVGVGASVGGSDGIGAGAGASIGGDDGVNAGVGASIGGGDGVNAGVGASIGGGSHGAGAGAGVSVGGSGSGNVATGGQGAVPGTAAGRARGVADSSATSAKTISIATLIGAPVWSKDRVLVGMIEEVKPGPNGKVDAVLRLNAALKSDKGIIRMRFAPRLSDRGALLLGYSKQKFLQLFAG